MANIIEFADTISITSISGKTFPVTISGSATYTTESIYAYARLSVAGVRCTLEQVDSSWCIVFAPMKVAEAKVLHTFFGAAFQAKKRNCVRISEDTKAAIETKKADLLAPHQLEENKLKQVIAAEVAAMPTYLMFHYSEYWPDYAPIEITREVVCVRHLTKRERKSGRYAADVVDTYLTLVETILPKVVHSPTLESIQARPSFAWNYWLVEQSEIDLLQSEWQAWKEADDAEKLAAQQAKEALARKEQEENQAKIKGIEENELFIWDAGLIYSSGGNQMLHSLGAIFSEKESRIGIYTTAYARDIPGANTTYSLRETLAKAGFVFDKDSKEWRIAYSEENGRTVVEFLKQYDTKAWPSELGFGRCWECGTYSKRLDRDGYCGC